MNLGTFDPKEPNAILDYELDWDPWLPVGETIQTSTWTLPGGITKVSDGINGTSTGTLIRLSEGTAGTDYVLINSVIFTPSGQHDEASVTVKVRHEDVPVLIATAGGATSNSYGTVAEADSYFLARLYRTAWDDATVADKSRALIAATYSLDQYDFLGIPVDDIQILKWPRQLDDTGTLIRNYPINQIPIPIKRACFELALSSLSSSGSVAAGTVDTVKVGSLSVTYASGSSAVDTSVDYSGLPIAAARFLKGLRLITVLA